MSKWAPILVLLFSISRARLHTKEYIGTSFEKTQKYINPNRLYFIMLQKDIIWEEGLTKQDLRELIGN